MTDDEKRKAGEDAVQRFNASVPRIDYQEKAGIGDAPGFTLVIRGGDLDAVNALGRQLCATAFAAMPALLPTPEQG